ncbi:hypothetical protein, partial [Escherichia coli]|uniref:hypothetical protein n=1 Tax=Escherichia coli TaxID=562 RepID=UPI0020007C5A
RQQAAKLIEEVNQMVADAGAEVALSALYTSAKMAAATTSGLVFACKATKDKVTDKKAEQDLINNAKATSAAIAAFID